MAKGSVRKKGKKWYYRFYVEDASGNLVQKECAGTESKSETEKLLRQAMENYESKKFIAKADNITLGQLLDTWAEEELKTGTLSNGTVGTYLQAINRIKQHPVSRYESCWYFLYLILRYNFLSLSVSKVPLYIQSSFHGISLTPHLGHADIIPAPDMADNAESPFLIDK